MYEKYDSGTIYLSDDSHLNIVGHGRVLIRFPNDKVKGIIGLVLHIFSLAWSLLLVSKFNDASAHVVFSNEGCKVVQGAMVLAKGVHVAILI